MKLQITVLLAAFASTFATEEPVAAAPVASAEQPLAGATPEQLRKGLKARGLAEDGSDSGANTSGGESKGGAGCFSARNTVEVQGKGIVSMDSLQIGDFVRAGKDFSRVFSFVHLERDTEYDFVQIHTEGSEAPLELTKNHMVFLSNKAVSAEDVVVGDILGDKKVTQIMNVKSTGLYAPITYEGSIVVNGIKSSCYVAIMDRVPVSQHSMSHMFFSLQRAACSVNFSWCEQETYTDGFSSYSSWAIKPYMHFVHSNTFTAPVQWLLTALSVVILPTWYTAEQFIVSPMISMMLVAFLVYKSQTKKVKSA